MTFHAKTCYNDFPLNGWNERLSNGSQTGHQAVIARFRVKGHILKYIDALFLSTWFYHVTLFRGKSPARAKSSNWFSMIYKRKITMWRNFLSVWFFMQHERWAFIYIILFRAYSIFVHRNCGPVSKSIRLLFRLHCMVMLPYGWCEFWKFQNLVTDQWLI